GVAMSVMTVKSLFFAANPITTSRLDLEEEIHEIETVIRQAIHRDLVKLVPCVAARPDDFLQRLGEEPDAQIIHFSGHGGNDGALYARDNAGGAQAIPQEGLRDLFRALGRKVRLVVLNACYSATLADTIKQQIDCVIGMRGPVRDAAAIKFSGGLYRAIG